MHLGLVRFRATDSARFLNSHGTLTSWIVLINLSKHVKTSRGFVNMASRAEIARWIFFSVKTTSLSHSERIGTARLWLDLLGSDGHIGKGCFALKLGFVSAEIFTNFGFVIDDFATDMLESYKDPDFGQVSKKILSENIGWLGWHQGSGKVGQKKQQNASTCDVIPRNPQSKTENVFFVCSLRLAESVEGLNSSLAQSPGKLLSCKLLKNCKKSGARRTERIEHEQSSPEGVCPE